MTAFAADGSMLGTEGRRRRGGAGLVSMTADERALGTLQ
jgi:hypothetical protein